MSGRRGGEKSSRKRRHQCSCLQARCSRTALDTWRSRASSGSLRCGHGQGGQRQVGDDAGAAALSAQTVGAHLRDAVSLTPVGSTVCFSQSVRGHDPNSCALYFAFMSVSPCAVRTYRAWMSPYRILAVSSTLWMRCVGSDSCFSAIRGERRASAGQAQDSIRGLTSPRPVQCLTPSPQWYGSAHPTPSPHGSESLTPPPRCGCGGGGRLSSLSLW